MPNQLKQQFRPIFGSLFDELSKAVDWDTVDLHEKARRLDQAYRAQRQQYDQPPYDEGTSLFEDAITCLELPD
jgi:hypothetical protein